MGNTQSDDSRPLVVALVGSARCGKSALLRYLQTRRPLFDPEAYHSTVAPMLEEAAVESRGRRHKLLMWDTSGEERFTGLALPYIRFADAFVFVYDITRPATFDALDQWWAMLRDIVPADARPEFIVVGTHVDNDDRRGVTQKRVQRWMEHRSLHPSCFFEVGATTGANCEIMVDTIVERVAEQRAERGSVVNVDMSDRLSEGMVSLQQAFGAPRHAPADTADAALTPEEQLKREQAHRAERRAKRRARQPTDNGGALAGGTGKGGRGVTREAAGAARPAGAAGGGREQLGDSEGKGMAAAASGLWSSLFGCASSR